MSLWSVDGVRNALDTLTHQVMPGTTSVSNKIDGMPAQGKLITKDAQIVVNDGTNDRITLGQRGDGTYGIKVSKTGYSSTTGASTNMVLNSDFNSFKIVLTGTTTITGPGTIGGSSSVVIPHNLGFIPASLGYVIGVGGGFNSVMPYIEWGTNGATQRVEIINLLQFTADSTNITIYLVNGPASTGTFTVRYYLLQETGA